MELERATPMIVLQYITGLMDAETHMKIVKHQSRKQQKTFNTPKERTEVSNIDILSFMNEQSSSETDNSLRQSPGDEQTTVS